MRRLRYEAIRGSPRLMSDRVRPYLRRKSLLTASALTLFAVFVSVRLDLKDTFGLGRIEQLAGNVGYLELLRFSDPDWADQALAAAMDRINETKALIIDLRSNHGGSPAMGVLLPSYFFDKPMHWVDFQ